MATTSSFCGASPIWLAVVLMYSLIDTADARVFQFDGYSADGTYRTIIPASDRLVHPRLGAYFPGVNKVEPGMSLGKIYAARTGRKVLLVPCAYGGTGLVGGSSVTWSAGGSNNRDLLNMIAQANLAIAAAQAQYPDSQLAAICGFQYEADGDGAVSQDAYTTGALATIAAMRSGITGAAFVPFIISHLVPEAITANPVTYAAIDTALVNVMAATPRGGIVQPASGQSPGNLHQNAVDARAHGARYDAAIAASATYSPAAPGAATSLSAGTPGDTSVALTLVAPSSGGFVLDYSYEISTNSGATWSVVLDGVSRALTAQMSGLTASTAYQARARAVNQGIAGTQYGTYTNTVSFTTAAAAATVNVRLTNLVGVVESGDATAGWVYTAAAPSTLTATHAGNSNKKIAAGTVGSFADTYAQTINGGVNLLLGVVTALGNPDYSTGAAGYKFGILNHSSGNYRVVIDGGATSVVAADAVACASNDLRRTDGTTGVWVAEIARAASPTVWLLVHTFAATYTGDAWCAESFGSSASQLIAGPVVGVNVV